MKPIVLILAAILMAGGCGQNPVSTTHTLVTNPQDEPTVAIVIPKAGDIVKFIADPLPERTHFMNFKVERKDLEDILHTWYQVSQDHWEHGYSHVAFEDRTGTIKLKDGTTIRWMVKPGGLATLTFQDGTILYLASELTPWKKNAEPAAALEYSRDGYPINGWGQLIKNIGCP